MTTATARHPRVEDGRRYWPYTDRLSAPEDDMLGQRLLYAKGGIVLAVVQFEAGDSGIADDGTGLTFTAHYPNGEPHPEYFEGLTMFDIARLWWEDGMYPMWLLGNDQQMWRVLDFRNSRFGRSYLFATSQSTDLDFPQMLANTGYVFHGEADDSPTLSFDELADLTTQSAGPEAKFFRSTSDELFANWDEFKDAGYRLAIEDLSGYDFSPLS